MWCTARSGIFDFISFPFLLFEFKACQRQCIFLRFWRTLYRAHSATDDASDKMTKEDFFFLHSLFSFFQGTCFFFGLLWSSDKRRWQVEDGGLFPPPLPISFLAPFFPFGNFYFYLSRRRTEKKSSWEREEGDDDITFCQTSCVFNELSRSPCKSMVLVSPVCVCVNAVRAPTVTRRGKEMGRQIIIGGGGEKKFPCTESFQPLLRHYRKKKKKKKLSSVSCNFIIEWVFFFCCSVVCEGSGAKSVGSDHRDRSSSSSSSGLDFADRYLADWNVD